MGDDLEGLCLLPIENESPLHLVQSSDNLATLVRNTDDEEQNRLHVEAQEEEETAPLTQHDYTTATFQDDEKNTATTHSLPMIRHEYEQHHEQTHKQTFYVPSHSSVTVTGTHDAAVLSPTPEKALRGSLTYSNLAPQRSPGHDQTTANHMSRKLQ